MTITSGWISIIGAFITGIIGPILVKLIINWFEKKRDPLSEAFTYGEKVQEKLENLREEYNADRLYILQFHNGGYYYPTGKSIQKFSMFYEVVKDPKYSVRHTFQNIPVHLFSKSLKELADDDYIAITDYRDATVATFGLKYIAEESGNRSSYMFTIRNIDGKLIGIFGVDYNKVTRLDQNVVRDLQVEAAGIGGELSKYLKR